MHCWFILPFRVCDTTPLWCRHVLFGWAKYNLSLLLDWLLLSITYYHNLSDVLERVLGRYVVMLFDMFSVSHSI